MSKDNTVALSMPEGMEDPLTELLRNGARRLIQQAIEAELAEMLAKYETESLRPVRRNLPGQVPECRCLPGEGPRCLVSLLRLPGRAQGTHPHDEPHRVDLCHDCHRSDQAKGCVICNTMLAMLYKLGMSAEKRWRRIRGFHHLAKVLEGIPFRDGVEVCSNNETDESRDAV